MSEEDPADHIIRSGRVMITGAGQLIERAARLRADQTRAAQQADADQQRRTLDQLAQERKQLIDGGRSVYGNIRQLDWDRPDAQHRVAEALQISDGLRDIDPVARLANTYLHEELARRHGDQANEWAQTAIRRFGERDREQADQHQAEDEARHTEHASDHSNGPNVETATTQPRTPGASPAAGRLDEPERWSTGNQPATAAQLARLQHLGVDIPDDGLTKAEASTMISAQADAPIHAHSDADEAAEHTEAETHEHAAREEADIHHEHAAEAEDLADQAVEYAATERHQGREHQSEAATEAASAVRTRRQAFPRTAAQDQARQAGQRRAPRARARRTADRTQGRDQGR